MATTVDPNSDVLGDDNKTYHAPGKPMETPATVEEYTNTEMEYEMYDQIKRLTTVLRKVGNFLQAQHPELISAMEKMNLFDEMVEDQDME